MFSSKPFLNQSKSINRDLVALSILCGIAYFANKERTIQVFKNANLEGRIAATATVGAGLGLSNLTLGRAENNKELLEFLVLKVLTVTISCIILTPIISKLTSKVEISNWDARKFAFISASVFLASDVQNIYFFASTHRFDDPAKPHSLSDRVALIENDSLRTMTKTSYDAFSAICRGIFEAYVQLGSTFYLLFSKIQVIGNIPALVKGATFPEVAPEKKKSEEIELGIHRFLNRILETQLNTSQKKEIRQILEGAFSPQEEEAIIDALLAHQKPLDPSEDQTNLVRANRKTLIRSMIQEGKDAALLEKKNSLTPKLRLEEKHQQERTLFSTLKIHAKWIHPETVEEGLQDPTELRFLNGRAEQIRGELPGIDAGNLWDRCANPASLEEVEELQKIIDQKLKDCNSKQERSEENFHPLLTLEYFSLLDQRLSLATDTLKWGRAQAHVDNFNRVTSRSLSHIHETLQSRYQEASIDFTLSAPAEDENIEAYFRKAETALQSLHTAELDLFEGNPSYVVQGSRIQDMQRRIIHAIDVPERREFLSIQSSEQRKEKRNRLITENLFLFCLKQTPDGQQLVRILDNASNSEEDSQLREVSQKAFDRLYKQALPILQSKLYTHHEFSVDVEQKDPITSLEPMKERIWELDLSTLFKELNLRLDFWYKDLQDVWIKHTSVHDREELRSLCTSSRQKKMAKLFFTWVLKKSGLPFERSLSFSHLQIPDERKQEAQALRNLSKHFFNSPFLQRIQERVAGARRAESPANEELLGTPLTSIKPASREDTFLDIECQLQAFDYGEDYYFGAPINILSLIQREEAYDPSASACERLNWIEDACEKPIYKRFNRGAFILFAAFFDTSKKLGGSRVSNEIILQFLNLVFDPSFEPLQSNNAWRKETLSCYLNMIFSGQKVPYDVTEEQRKYLVQFATLAEFTLPELNITNNPLTPDVRIAELGCALQRTSIGLEGTEESTLQLSFQTAQLQSGVKTRKLLDALRARQGTTLPKHLLDAVMEAFPIDHDEGQQGIVRAFSYAFRGAPQEEIAYIQKLLSSYPLSDLNTETLAIPSHVFLNDRLIVLEPGNLGAQGVVRTFNQELIQSNQAPQMLMGYAREIKRLTALLMDDHSEDKFAELLKVKIGYQQLKAQFFDGKVALEGFLKLAVDDAEFAMASSSHFLADMATGIDCDEIVRLLHETQDPDPALKTYAEKQVEKVFKRQQEQRIAVEFSPPFFLQFGRNDLDIISGCVYFDGEQYIELPSELQNHPHVRSLGIHDLPYVINNDGSFSHYTTEGGRRVAQVRIALSEAAGVIIQRRLNTSLQGPEEIRPLQYVPLEKLQQFPTALLQRMGVKDFWMDPEQNIYGYTEKGKPIFSLSQGWQRNTIRTASGTFYLANDRQLNDENLRSALEHLQNIIPQDEILVRADQRLIYIPSLGATLTFKEDQAWHWTSSDITGMTLDLTRPPFESTFVLKWEGGASRSPRQLEEQLIMLRKHLAEAEAQEGLSLSAKGQIETMQKQIVATEKKLSQLDKRLYVTLLPEEDRVEIKAELDGLVYQLEAISRGMSQTSDRLESRELQRRYLETEKRYEEQKERYEACCTQSPTVTYETSYPNLVKGRDLIGALFLLNEQLLRKDEIDTDAWIQELARYPSNRPFDEQTLKLLRTCSEDYEEDHPLISLYSQLLLTQHYHILFKEAEKSLTPDQEKRLKSLEGTYTASKERCEALYGQLTVEGTKIPAPVMTLMHQHCPDSAPVTAPTHQDPVSFSHSSMQDAKALATQSLLERLFLADAIACKPKNSSKEIPEEQRRLIKSFREGSHDQATGFYVEAFGMFSVKAFYKEFALQGEEALFGLKRRDLDTLFKAFESKGWISDRETHDLYYTLTANSGHHPLVCIQNEDLHALISSLPISPADREKVVQRIRSFFFQVAHASFSFSWKDAAGEARFLRSLTKERAKLQQQMLEAKFVLDDYLAQTGMSMTQLKRCVLFNQELDRPEGRTALIRYLLLQTEVHHIDNVLKAPTKGERNQIELLSTARQYPIDLLLRPAENDEERKLQIINLAFLLSEEDNGFRCNPMQVSRFSSLMLDNAHPESIDAMQARMGFGKTELLPSLAIVRLAMEALKDAEDKSLIRYIVPKAVLQDNAASFHAKLSRILDSSVVQDRPFSRFQLDPADKKRSLNWALKDLENRLAFYKNAQKHGIVLIQSYEIRQSLEAQEAALGFLAISGQLDEEEQALCVLAIQKIGQIRALKTYSIFDELDATQDFKACEVNFTEGKRLPISPETIRPLERLIQSVGRHHGRPIEELAPRVLQDLGINDPDGIFAEYVSSASKRVDDIPGLQDALAQLSPEKYNGIYLIRATLLDPNILDFMHSKQPNTHFGVRFTLSEGKRVYSFDPDSGSALLIAVPYEGTNTPKGLSTYDNSEVAAITTLRYYRSNETLFEDVHLDFLIKQMQKNSIPEFLYSVVDDIRNAERETFMDRLRQLSGLIDAAEIEQAKTKFYQDFLRNPSREVRSFFGRAVVATQVHTDEARANSNRYEMGTPEDQLKGCSGTVSSTSSYFEKPAIDPKADGMLSIAIMGRENNAPVNTLPPIPEPCDDYLDYILTSLLADAKPCTRAIIDVAGLCKSRDGLPETIVAKLWELLQAHDTIEGIDGIVYYGKDNVKRLYRGPAHPPIPCTTAMERLALPGKRYFSFYGQKNTRGSDIKQANGAHALVTMDQNVPNADAKQGVLRFRDLVQESSGQTFTFVLTALYADMLQQKKTTGPIDAKDIVKDLRNRERDQEHHDALILFREELKSHAKQAASYMGHQVFNNVDLANSDNKRIFLQFLRDRDALIPMVERSIAQLEDKYGGSLIDVDRNEFIEAQCRIYNGVIDQLKQLAEQAATDLAIDEPEIKDDFFKKRIEVSKNLFESRYPADTPVQISAVDTGAEAVAMALAQAEAEALAEAVAETISEAIVQVQDRLPNPKLAMTKMPHFSTPNDWYLNPNGAAINGFKALKHLIHPDLRDQILLSPHIQSQNIVSHFALIPNDPTQHLHIFISQEEADRWITEFASSQGDYTLVDLRAPRLGGESIQHLNMKEAVLRQTVEIQNPLTETEDLRGLNLTNIAPEQLLPSLSIEGVDQGAISALFDLSSFGVSRDSRAPASLKFVKEGETFSIQGTSTKITLPIKNKWLEPLFKNIPVTQGKFRWLQDEFIRRTEELRQTLAELRQKEEALNARKRELSALIQDASQFSISRDLQHGLEVRDHECLNAQPSYGGNTRADRYIAEPEHVKKCGKTFLDMMGQIAKAQDKCAKDGKAESFRELHQLFNSFISDMMQKSRVLTTSAVFDEKYWNENKHSLPPFDLVYGRILHTVHYGDFKIAKECGRDDCNQIFNHTLPEIQETLGKMKQAVGEIPRIEAEIERIQEEIAKFSAQMQCLDEADKCIKNMENEVVGLLRGLENEGILFVSPSEDPTLFWDRLSFDQLDALPEQELEPQLTTRFPVYQETFNNMVEYQRRIHSLCLPEKDTMEEHKRLLKAVKTFAQRVEPRTTETTWA